MSDIQVIPPASIEALKAQPHMRDQFDQVWGVGAAARVLDTNSNPHRVAEEESMTERDKTLAGRVWQETGGAIGYGMQEAANQAIATVEDFDEWGSQKLDELGVPSRIIIDENGARLGFYREVQGANDLLLGGQTGTEGDTAQIDLIDAPDTIAGGIVAGVSQFATGYMAVGKVTKLKGLLGAFGNGAIVDALLFDPNDKNVTALVESFGVDAGAFGDLMATDPDDPEWQNRLRNAGEGALAGAVVEMLALGVRARKLTQEGRAEEAADAMASAVRVSREIEKELAKEAGNIAKEAEEAVKAGDTLDEVLSKQGIIEVEVDAPTPRDPDQLELDIAREVEPVTFFTAERARMLTPEEIENIRYHATLAKTDTPQNLAKGQAIVRPGSVKQWEDVLPLLASMREVVKDEWMKTPGVATERWTTTKLKAGQAIREIAALTGEDVNQVVKRFNSGFAKKEDMAAEIVARSAVVKQLMRQTDALAEAISKNEFDRSRFPGYQNMDALRADYNAKVSLAMALAKENKAARSAVGRALNAMKMDMSENAVLQRVMEDPTFRQNIDTMAAAQVKARTEGKPVLSAMENAQGVVRKFLDDVNRFRINALLSGPGTQEVNFVSTLLNTVAIPTQQIVGAVATANPRQFLHAVRTMRGMVAGSQDAVKAALDTWWKKDAILDAQNTKFDAQELGVRNEDGRFWSTVSLPSRVLMGMDEFFKQSAYRGRVMADALEIADVKKLTGERRDLFVKGYIADSFDDAGRALREDALLQAQRSTFTEPLERGTWGYGVQMIAQRYALARFIMPFVRTPINILSTAWQHLPAAGFLSHRLRADLAAGGTRRAQAVGKQALGMALVTMALAGASEGNLTGSGPKNPRLRKAWLANNRPYSVKITQEDGSIRWVSYARYEPMAQVIAMFADFAEIMNNDYNENDARGVEGIAFALMMATAENSINKTFTQGLHDFFTVLVDSNDNKRERALNAMVSSFVPNALNQLNGDEAYREARSIMDAITSKTSAYNKLDPKRNVLGEVIWRPFPKYDPMTLMTKDVMEVDPVMDQIWKVAKGAQTVAGNPSRFIDDPREPGGRIDLSQIEYAEGQSLYDRYLELIGTVEIGGRTLRQELERTFNSNGYQRLMPGTDGMTKGTKAYAIQRILSDYRKAAQAELPELTALKRDIEKGKLQLFREFQRGNTQRQLFASPEAEDLQILR